MPYEPRRTTRTPALCLAFTRIEASLSSDLHSLFTAVATCPSEHCSKSFVDARFS